MTVDYDAFRCSSIRMKKLAGRALKHTGFAHKAAMLQPTVRHARVLFRGSWGSKGSQPRHACNCLNFETSKQEPLLFRWGFQGCYPWGVRTRDTRCAAQGFSTWVTLSSDAVVCFGSAEPLEPPEPLLLNSPCIGQRLIPDRLPEIPLADDRRAPCYSPGS
jgi:hypothetical protein